MANADTIKRLENFKVDPSKAFQFSHVDDHGPADPMPTALCPHCGAMGRYIYSWYEFGVGKSAMAGCYKALTGHIVKGDTEDFYRILAEKQAKGKKLNTWQITVLRMQQFIAEGKYSVDWCEQKIKDAIADQKRFAAQKWGGR